MFQRFYKYFWTWTNYCHTIRPILKVKSIAPNDEIWTVAVFSTDTQEFKVVRPEVTLPANEDD